MKIDKFIKEFDNAKKTKKDVSAVLAKRKTRDYVPYYEKVTRAKNIVSISCYDVEKSGMKRFIINSPNRYFLFIRALFESYTDLEFVDEKVVEEFDLINERGIIPMLIALMGEAEYQEFQTILTMVLDDEMENYRSLAGFLDSKVDLLGALLESLESVKIDEGKAIK